MKNSIPLNQRIKELIYLDHLPQTQTTNGIYFYVDKCVDGLKAALYTSVKHTSTDIQIAKRYIEYYYSVKFIEVLPYDNPNIVYSKPKKSIRTLNDY